MSQYVNLKRSSMLERVNAASKQYQVNPDILREEYSQNFIAITDKYQQANHCRLDKLCHEQGFQTYAFILTLIGEEALRQTLEKYTK